MSTILTNTYHHSTQLKIKCSLKILLLTFDNTTKCMFVTLFAKVLNKTFCEKSNIWTSQLKVVHIEQCFSTFFDSRHPSLAFNKLEAPLATIYY